MNRNNKKISILLLLVMVVQIFTPFLNIIGYATKDTVIDEIVLEEAGKKNGKPAYNLKAKWSIDDKSKKKGDYFELKLPDDLEMEFLPGIVYLNAPDGKVYAEGKIEGNTIKFTFTDLVESEVNIRGDFYINGLTTKKDNINKGIVEKPTNITEDGNIIWEGPIKVDTGTVVGEGGGGYYSHNFRKNPQDGSYTIERKDGNIILTWNIDINTTEKDQYKGNIVIKDTVDGSQVIDIESFDLRYLEIYNKENISGFDNIKNLEKDDIKVNKFKVSEDGKSFELDIDVYGNYGYILWYETKISMEDYFRDMSLGMDSYKNHISVEYDNKEIEASTGEYDFAKIGQTQAGDIPYYGEGKVKLIKIDDKGNSLENAKFKIEKYNSLEPEENERWEILEPEIKLGEYVSENFKSGVYRFTEIEAPKGYKKLKEPIVKAIDFEIINEKRESLKDYSNKIEIRREENSENLKKYNEIINEIEKFEYDEDFGGETSRSILDDLYSIDPEFANSLFGADIDSALDKVIERLNLKKLSYEEEEEKLEREINNIKNDLKSLDYDFEKEAIVIEIENKENKKDLEIVKKWEDLEEYKGEKETLKAKFQLFAYKLVDGKPTPLDKDELQNIIGTEDEPEIYEVEYDEDSIVLENLPYEDEKGNEYIYTIRELDLPDFDKEDDKVIKLSEYVDEDDVKVEFTNTYNPKPKGSLKIKKVDSKDETKVLEGVKFTLKNNELGYEESLESDGEGLLEFKDLEPGKYTLKEVKPLDGYEKIDFEIEVIIDEEGKTEIVKTENNLIEFKEDTLIVKNVKEKPVEDPKGSLKIKKVDSKDETKVLEGVKFTLKNSDLGYEESLESDGEGLLEFKDLKPGKYTLKEIETLNGYESLNVEIEVEIDEKGKTEIVKTENDLIEFKEDTLIVKNAKEKPVEDPKGSLKIKKVDSKDKTKLLEGVKFAIKDEEGKIVSEDITTSDGSLEFKDLEPGKYTLKEMETLNGYESLDVEIEVEIDEKGKTKIDKIETNLIEYKGDILTVKNVKEEPIEKPKSGFKLKKVDSKDKTGLTGAVFELYKIIEKEVIVEKEVETELEDGLEIEEPEEIENEDTIEDESGKVDEIKDEVEDTDEDEKEVIVEYENKFIKKVTTDNQGFVSLDDLEPGEYILKEIKAPEGYKLEEKEIKIVITKDDNENYNYQIDEVDGVRFDSETETIEVDNVKILTEPDKPEPEEPTDPDTPKPEKPTKPNRPPKPEEPIKPVDPDKPEPEKPEEEVEEDIKGDIVIDEEEKEIEKEENKVEEDIKEEIRDDILILEDSIENSLEKQNIKYLPKTGDGLNKKTYGIFTLILGSFLILLGIKREKNED